MGVNPSDLLRRAAAAFAGNDLPTADSLARAALESRPSDVDAWRLLGRIRTRQSLWADADAAFDRAARLRPGDAEVAVGRGQLRLRQGRTSDAIALFEDALGRRPDLTEARLALADAWRRSGEISKARAALGTPGIALGYLIAADCAIDEGDAAEAERLLRAGLDKQPEATQRHYMHRRLGELLERANRPGEAFAEYVAGKRATPASFDWHQFRSRFDRCRSFFQASQLERLPRASIRTRRPIFIASVPRSGTSLLARQIAAHPQGGDAGETPALHEQVEAWSDPSAPSTSWPLCMRGFLARDLDEVARAYLDRTAPFAPLGTERVADKHLWNWLYVGLIAVAFPEATIVHLHRDPIDTGLSCFERLQNSSMPWAATLEGVGEMLARSEVLMEHWRRLLPGRIVSVRYEDLVADPRSQLGAVLDAAGLPWSDDCLRHDRLRADAVMPAPTLSAEQVKRPLYRSAIGRADRFGSALDPLREAYGRTRAALGG